VSDARFTTADWVIEETCWQPDRNQFSESLFTVANGYVGIRGFPEEPFGAGPTLRGVYVAGVFAPGADGIPELVNVPNILATEITLGGRRFRLSDGNVKKYRRWLDMRRGLLHRCLIHADGRRTTRLEFERFASLSNEHLTGQAVTITPLNWSGKVSIVLRLDGRVRNVGKAHLRLLRSRHVAPQLMYLATETRGSRIRIGHACRCRAWVRQAAPPPAQPIGRDKAIGVRFDTTLECGQRAVFDRIVSTHTSRDPQSGPVEPRCLEDARRHRETSYGTFRRRHIRAWRRRWQRADIEIDGPREEQQAIRFAVFHLTQACPPQDPTVSIAAKGLTGEGYRGHVFWDTEVFMLPFFVHTAPRAARRLLEYRYRTLDGARRKALAAGYEGAMFAWESAETGDEVCPPYVPDPMSDGLVRVLTGELQQHVSADVAYAAWRYVQATGDQVFRRERLLPLAVLTARFWASRAWFNRKQNRYEIRDVIGPDEFHEHVNNDAYTNFLATWNLRLAADEMDHFQATQPDRPPLRLLNVMPGETAQWRTIAEGMFLPVLADGSLWLQHDGFLKLVEADPSRLCSRAAYTCETLRLRQLRGSQVLKQPDVLMLLALFPGKFSRRVKRRNWDFYEPRTAHESSLSAGVHSLVASDIGLRRKAYEYFRQSAFIDIHDRMGNTDTGLHCAALGGTWQAVVRGFLGLRPGEMQPKLRAHLPRGWDRIATRIKHKDRWYAVEATRSATRIEPCG